MDKTVHDHAAGRDATAHDAGDHPAASRDRAQPDPGTAPVTRPAELTPTAAGFRIRLCTWCKQIDLRGARRDTDVVSLLIVGKILLASWNGKPVLIQDGICEQCSQRLHPKDGQTDNPLVVMP